MALTSNDSFMIIEDPPVKRSTPIYLFYQYARSICPTISFALLIKLYIIYQEDPDLYESESKPWKAVLYRHPELKEKTQHIKNIGHIFQQMTIELSECSDREVVEGLRTVAEMVGTGFEISFIFSYLINIASGKKRLVIQPTLEILDVISSHSEDNTYSFLVSEELLPLYQKMFPRFNFYCQLSEITSLYDIVVYLYRAHTQKPPSFPRQFMEGILSLCSVTSTVFLIIPEKRWFQKSKSHWRTLLNLFHQISINKLYVLPSAYCKTKEKDDSVKTKRLLMILSSTPSDQTELIILKHKNPNMYIARKPTALFSICGLLSAESSLNKLYTDYTDSLKKKKTHIHWLYEYAPGLFLHFTVDNNTIRVHYNFSKGKNTNYHGKTVRTTDEAIAFLERFPFIPDISEILIPYVKKMIYKTPACAIKTIWYGLSDEFSKKHKEANNELRSLFSKNHPAITVTQEAKQDRKFLPDKSTKRFVLDESSFSALCPATATRLDYQIALSELFPNKSWQDLPVKLYESLNTFLSYASDRGIDVQVKPIEALLSSVSNRLSSRQSEVTEQLNKTTYSIEESKRLNDWMFQKGGE